MPINIYIIFSKYNIFINIKLFKIYIKKSIGMYKFKGKNKKSYYSIIIMLNNILNKLNLKTIKILNLYLKGTSNYKNNIIKFIYKYFITNSLNNIELNLIDLTKISF